MKKRLDMLLVERCLVSSRSQAENYIKLGRVRVGDRIIRKPGFFVDRSDFVSLEQNNQYVSRAGLKLESVASSLKIDFREKVVLDVGSSTGGFTDYSLRNGAKKVIAVDVGTNQLHKTLRDDPRIELHEKTDIRKFNTEQKIDTVLIDVSFISIKEIIPSVLRISPSAEIIAMVKPQFEAGKNGTVSGIVKNNSFRRRILNKFESWCRTNNLYIKNKRDSSIKGAKGNQERFYILKNKNTAQ